VRERALKSITTQGIIGLLIILLALPASGLAATKSSPHIDNSLSPNTLFKPPTEIKLIVDVILNHFLRPFFSPRKWMYFFLPMAGLILGNHLYEGMILQEIHQANVAIEGQDNFATAIGNLRNIPEHIYLYSNDEVDFSRPLHELAQEHNFHYFTANEYLKKFLPRIVTGVFKIFTILLAIKALSISLEIIFRRVIFEYASLFWAFSLFIYGLTLNAVDHIWFGAVFNHLPFEYTVNFFELYMIYPDTYSTGDLFIFLGDLLMVIWGLTRIPQILLNGTDFYRDRRQAKRVFHQAA